DEVMNCNEAGVLGVLPGIIGTMMAAETIKLITDIGRVTTNELLTYNLLNHQVYKIQIAPNPLADQFMPGSAEAFFNADYNSSCGSEPDMEISPEQALALLQQEGALLVDVRNTGEMPEIKAWNLLHIPLAEIEERAGELQHQPVVLVCNSGKRSLMAARLLKKRGCLHVYSLKDGLVNGIAIISNHERKE